MINIQSLSLRAGTKLLFSGASLQIHTGQKIGLVGANGAGKTTLFKALMNEVALDEGSIAIPQDWVVAYVQQSDLTQEMPMLDYVCQGDTLYAQALKRLQEVERQDDHNAIVQAHDRMDEIQGYQVPHKAKQMLAGLGFSESEFSQPIGSFSGGWQMRLRLARALMQRSDFLLLDEPTNHLDLEAVSWLEQWLQSYSGAVFVISHDRDFLDTVVQGIAHIDQGRIYFYSGNFAAFERMRNEKLMQQQSLHEKQKVRMQQLKTFIDRFKAKASKAKQAQSRVKALQRMEEVAAVQATNPFSFEFFEPKHQPDPMLSIEKIDFSFPEKDILQQVDRVVRAGDRLGLVGVNGSGKTTFLKLLVGELKPSAGKVIQAKGVSVGYFAQEQLESLRPEWSPLKHLLMLEEPPTDQEGRDFLGGFGFSNQMCMESCANFSGGEKARLALAIIVYQAPNLLILDEPTNHLDMETRDALDLALQNFTGALILVSHDKHLLTSIADQFWWVHNRTVTTVEGTLEDYLAERLKAASSAKAELKQDSGVVNKKQLRQASAMNRKQLEAKVRPYKKQQLKLEEKMARAQSELDAINEQLQDEALYDGSQSEKLQQMLRQQAQMSAVVESCELEWMEQEELIEALTSEAEVSA